MSYSLDRDKLFDNIMYVYKATISSLTSTVSTEEIDLDLPRGYIAKIALVILEVIQSGTVDNTYELRAALVNDPDDTESIVIPENTVKHDVIADLNLEFNYDQTDGLFYLLPSARKTVSFKENELDVISARNMRFNGDDVNNNGDGAVACTIYYTIEKVKGSENLLNLLDIL